MRQCESERLPLGWLSEAVIFWIRVRFEVRRAVIRVKLTVNYPQQVSYELTVLLRKLYGLQGKA